MPEEKMLEPAPRLTQAEAAVAVPPKAPLQATNSKSTPYIPRWPSQVEYQDALQNPALCFADTLLRTCVPLDLSPFGLPSPISGQFANVYRMQSPDGRCWGVKLFLRHLSSRTVQYHALQTHLLRLSPAPSWLVPFAYHEKGIRINGAWFPVLQMPWLRDATPLNTYLGEIINDPLAVRRLRDTWRKLNMEMEREQFAHGDLQHGNVCVRHGRDGKAPVLHLLDYDGAWVPALSGRVATEAGHPAYQHPGREPGDFGPRLDRFAAVAVYTTLLILAHAPELWYRFDNGDNMLWRREDFVQTQAQGRALFELSRHPNAYVRRAAESFRTICEAPATLVPDLERYAMMAEMI
ncbi:MAG: hypothetical protein H7145_20080 [Akkermansiaceae bacterium]|nr:hypothetical protein [Armatimonadota bacterium]